MSVVIAYSVVTTDKSFIKLYDKNMNNIKYLNEDSEVINDSVDNPNDLEKYARQIAKMYKLKYNDDDTISCDVNRLKEMKLAHKLISSKMACGKIKYCSPDERYYFTVDFE